MLKYSSTKHFVIIYIYVISLMNYSFYQFVHENLKYREYFLKDTTFHEDIPVLQFNSKYIEDIRFVINFRTVLRISWLANDSM